MYTDHIHKPTIILEAIGSYDLWIWHAFFGLPGDLNDINVLERSSAFAQLAQGRAPAVNYSINGHEYIIRYYLVDGIYIHHGQHLLKQFNCHKEIRENILQESERKDVERAFRVLQARFAIVHGPAHSWDETTLKKILCKHA
ncbi:hypothetical protein Dsin_009214 [Dipteronia sinensis]|uniref:Uncharacterized protein n=1 Tax=Dipteronia sinensis TaxID=43782 RepID=A0AAE0EBP8_9ROSI|nr:hypothetical protein Dsin_009214 [Dipteronia sinensis]